MRRRLDKRSGGRGLAVWLAALLLAAAAGNAAEDAGAQAARAAIESLFSELAVAVRDDSLGADEKRAIVDRVLSDHLLLSVLSAQALGPTAERFSREQLVDFAHEYERYLVHFFEGGVARWDGKKLPEVRLASHNPETGIATVTARGETRPLVTPGRVAAPREAPRHVAWDFSLLERRGRWQIAAVRINGVDVSRNFRAQLQEVLERSEPEALIAELRQRNQGFEAENPFAEQGG